MRDVNLIDWYLYIVLVYWWEIVLLYFIFLLYTWKVYFNLPKVLWIWCFLFPIFLLIPNLPYWLRHFYLFLYNLWLFRRCLHKLFLKLTHQFLFHFFLFLLIHNCLLFIRHSLPIFHPIFNLLPSFFHLNFLHFLFKHHFISLTHFLIQCFIPSLLCYLLLLSINVLFLCFHYCCLCSLLLCQIKCFSLHLLLLLYLFCNHTLMVMS
jgi:hypothetical protein